MSLESAAALFRNIQSSTQSAGITSLNFQWFGGEPLLLSPAFYKRIFHLQKRIFDETPAIRVTNSVQSNFTVMDDDRVGLLKEHFDEVGISIDVFGGLRINQSGKSLEQKALKNLEMVRHAGIRVSGTTVLTRPLLANIESLYAFYRTLGLDFRLLPLERGLYKAGQDFEVTPSEILIALCKLADCWFSDPVPLVVEPLVRYLYLVKRMLLAKKNRVKIYDTGETPSIIQVAVDGSVRSYGERFDESLGNIFSDRLADIIAGSNFRAYSLRVRDRVKLSCTNCRFLGRACAGDPVAEGKLDIQSTDIEGKRICEVTSGLIAYLEGRLVEGAGWTANSAGDVMFNVYRTLQ